MLYVYSRFARYTIQVQNVSKCNFFRFLLSVEKNCQNRFKLVFLTEPKYFKYSEYSEGLMDILILFCTNSFKFTALHKCLKFVG